MPFFFTHNTFECVFCVHLWCVSCVHLCLFGCRFDPRAFRWAQTMRLAVEEINQSAELLPNYTLGYNIFDSCAYPLTGQRAAMAVLNGQSEDDSPTCSGASPLLAVIGESGSAQSMVVSRILQPFRIPMVMIFSFICNPTNSLFFLLYSFCILLQTDQLLFFMCMFYWQKKLSHLLQSNPQRWLSGESLA